MCGLKRKDFFEHYNGETLRFDNVCAPPCEQLTQDYWVKEKTCVTCREDWNGTLDQDTGICMYQPRVIGSKDTTSSLSPSQRCDEMWEHRENTGTGFVRTAVGDIKYTVYRCGASTDFSIIYYEDLAICDPIDGFIQGEQRLGEEPDIETLSCEGR